MTSAQEMMWINGCHVVILAGNEGGDPFPATNESVEEVTCLHLERALIGRRPSQVITIILMTSVAQEMVRWVIYGYHVGVTNECGGGSCPIRKRVFDFDF